MRAHPAGGGAPLAARLLACGVALAALPLSGLPLAAPAPETPADPDLAVEGMRRAGPFRLRPFVTLKDVGYDDNVLYTDPEREGDYTATAGAGLDALLLGGDRGGIFLSGEGDYVAFADFNDLNHWNGFGRGRGILLLKRAVVSLEDRFLSVVERPNGEIDQRLRRDQNRLTAAARTRGERRWGGSAFVRRERVDYSAAGEFGSEEAALRLNRDESALSLTGELRILPKTTFLLEGSIEEADFDSSAERRDSRVRSLLPGLRFDPSASIQGEVKVGVARLEARQRPDADYEGTVGEGRLSTRLGGKARLKGTFVRELVFSIYADDLYFISTHWSAAYEHFLSRRLSAELLYGQGTNRYSEGVREDEFETYQLALRHRPGGSLALQAAAQRQVRDSNDDAFDRTRNLFTLGTVYEF
jgi:hypothetical protein